MEDEEEINWMIADCSNCTNELCWPDPDYQWYRNWVSVDTFEMVIISMNIMVFLAGIIGNLLVSQDYIHTQCGNYRNCSHTFLKKLVKVTLLVNKLQKS